MNPERSAPLELLVENHRAFLGFLERRVGSRETAEDLLQEAFGRAVARVAELDAKESVVAWFYRVLRNAVVDHHRRRGAAVRALETFGRQLEVVDPGVEVHDALCGCIGRLAAGLKPEYAEAIRRVELEGAPVQTYAAETRLTPGNAAVRLFRARQALRRRVVEACGTCAEHGCRDCGCGMQAGAGRSPAPGL